MNLDTISNITTFAQVKKLKTHSSFLAQGHSRMVFKASEGEFVYKIAKNLLGLMQNHQETWLNRCDSLLLPLEDWDYENFLWVTMPLVDIRKPGKIKGISLKEWYFYAINVQKGTTVYHNKDLNKIEIPENEDFINSIHNLIHHNLLADDIIKKDSFGFIGDDMYLVDYGFTKETWKLVRKGFKNIRTVSCARDILERFI